MFRYSYDALVYFGEDISESIKRVARYGYDAIELVGEPDTQDGAAIRRQCEDAGIGVSSICSIYTGEARDLTNKSAENRRKAVDYSKRVADLAAASGAPIMIVAPSPVGKMAPESAPEQEWAWAVEGIKEIADHAASQNVKLCIEAWNRYETHFINRIPQALDLMRDVDKPNVGVMGDTFHMNIDDPDIAGAIRDAGKAMIHIHFADSNRAAPGAGHTDFVPIMQALKDVGYEGHITFELLPASSDPFATLRQGGGREFYDAYTRQAIEVIKSLEAKLV
ncbi:sugar phosphate isomerase/epimerase family protein [Prosthecomicrobium pneumaticum]|uniref:Sugar phosphate isomerase/epimerase n=1 Tax=Prosthecomicrobium pneumaticum TaxID=81895 RepID=A0A7W9L439_9HYPH|nr:sugar phosphate isomerase/epimerase family protein [Prosthecomicrobium pneumaticum]MBB5755169.1 sugar phosphate isomerase/epimerase [Prosthecomicrobium pneumaticum]